MLLIQFIQYGPATVGLLVALVALFLGRRGHVDLPRPVRLRTAIGMAIALALMVGYTAWSVWPTWVAPLGEDAFLIMQLARHLAPLVLCVVALAFLIAPRPAPGPPGAAALEPRTILTFASRPWLWTVGVAVAVSVVLALLAGFASHADDAGRYVNFEVRLSASTSAGSTIYGWWFSVPCLLAIALILAITLLALHLISRPAPGADAEGDAAERSARIRSVLRVATGGLLLHIGTVLQSLASAASLRGGFEGGAIGWIEISPSFAALGPALYWSAAIAVVAGFTMWWFTLASVVLVRSRRLTAPVPA